ncbi:Kelch 2 [Brachionus plicatilis]|uniref:Kelch 2 n=1 Tax=Brachionus plicatilis TaxID=10195 RepID=A0A3M7RX71_BRAPC|nr:Kelch 2 [Brachionus plicatilis]
MLSSSIPIMVEAQSTHTDQIYIEDFQSEKCESLFKFRNENLFTDVFIYVEGVEFPCHKVILCASSQYFQAMFSCDLKESRHGKVFIENMSPWTMKRLLDFIYTAKIEISYENVIELFNAAVLFQLSKLVDKCISYVKQNVDLSNCVEIYLFASMHGLTDLHTHTYQFILENFRLLIDLTIDLYSKLTEPPCDNLFAQLNSRPMSNLTLEQARENFYSSFIRLDQKSFCNLLESDQLNVKREIYVYYSIMKWIEYQSQCNNQKEVSKLHEQLFKHLRLNSLSKEELEFILSNDKMLHQNEQLKQKVQLALGDFESSQENIRPSTLPKDYICSLAVDNFDLFDVSKSKWDRLVEWPPAQLKSEYEFEQMFDGYSVCTVNNVLYVIGGMVKKMDTTELKNSVYRFDPVKNEWSSLSSMRTKRAFHHTIHLSKSKEQNYILVMYGLTNDQEEDLEQGQFFKQSMTIEFYTIERDEWKEVNILNNSILSHHLFSLYHRTEVHHFDLTTLVSFQIEQSKLVVGLKNLIYILNDNCIHCFEFDELNVNSYLPYFRLPKNLSGFVLAKAVSFKTANILTQFDMESSGKKSLFSWYSDSEDKSPSMSSTSSNSLQSPTIHDYDEEGSCKRVIIRQEKEALMFILNPEQGLLYEFYPGKNKLLRLPNLILKHDKFASFVLKIKSQVIVTGGVGDEDGFFHIESYDRDTRQWSVLTKYPVSVNKIEQYKMINSFFRLKMSLV